MNRFYTRKVFRGEDENEYKYMWRSFVVEGESYSGIETRGRSCFPVIIIALGYLKMAGVSWLVYKVFNVQTRLLCSLVKIFLAPELSVFFFFFYSYYPTKKKKKSLMFRKITRNIVEKTHFCKKFIRIILSRTILLRIKLTTNNLYFKAYICSAKIRDEN